MKIRTKWVFPILLAGMLVLSACQPASQAMESSTPVENNQKQEIPAIDQIQPDDFATATFSMG
ncbi:MAG: hypothetical protein RBT34_03170 [Anaerolineaceae bacterium]|jgi:hypothetical protein|nr:hypothetical protein [Anaerolineaceae bacterium]